MLSLHARRLYAVPIAALLTLTGLYGAGCGGDDDNSSSSSGSINIDSGTSSGAVDGSKTDGQSSSSSSGSTSSSSSGGTDGGTDANVDAGPQAQPVGGTVSGLGNPPAAGLVLTLNGSNDLPINSNGGFTFPTAANLLPGTTYTVAIKTQPTGKTCSVSAATGTVASSPITNVVVNCEGGTFTVGGAVTGLATGASVVLTNNGLDDLTVSDGNPFAFATAVGTGSAYNVQVKTQPSGPVQNCVVSNGVGTIAGANVTNVAVACTTTKFKVNVSVSGLAGGSSVILTNNGGDALTVSGNSTVPFATTVESGKPYAVAVQTQPSSPAQTCTVGANATGTVTNGDVTVAVTCSTSTYTVGGTVTGLNNGNTIVLGDTAAGTTNLTLNGTGADVPFTFANARNSGSGYNVSIVTQPAGQTCTISGNSGTIGSANVNTVQVNCIAGSYTVGGSIVGLSGSVNLTDGTDTLTGVSGSSFTFPPLVNGTAYNVAVTAQPTFAAGGRNQTCTVANGSGTLAGANVTDVALTCVTNKFKVGGQVLGLKSGSQLVITNTSTGANSNTTVTGNGSLTDTFTFPVTVNSGNSYTASVGTPTGGVEQSCTVTSNGPGVVGDTDVNGILITCKPVVHSVSVQVSGLATNSNVQFSLLRTETPASNAPDSPSTGSRGLTVTSDGTFVFTNPAVPPPTFFPVASGQQYAVTITAQPLFSGAGGANQTCSFTGPTPATGTIGSSNVVIQVNCVTNFFFVNGTLSGLNNGGGTNSVSLRLESPTSTGTPAFPPSQTSANDVTRNSDGVFQFGPACNPASASCTLKVKSGEKYYLSVSVQPNAPPQTCRFASPNTCIGGTQNLQACNPASAAACTGGGGACTGLSQTMGNSDTSNIPVSCTTNAYFVGGSVSGLQGDLTLRNTVTGSAGGGAGESSNLLLSGPGTYTFTSLVTSGNTYNVPSVATPGTIAVADQPKFGSNGAKVNQTCTVANPTGTIVNTDVNNVNVSCTTNKFHVIAHVTLAASASTPLQISDGLGGCAQVGTAGTTDVNFNTSCGGGTPADWNSGSSYNISVTQAPGNADQNCTISGGNVSATQGFIRDGNETINVVCTRKVSTITARVFGLSSGSVSLQNNGGDTQTQTGATAAPAGTLKTFTTQIPNGSAYAVTVSAQPTADQWCTVVSDPGSTASPDGAGIVPVSGTPATINVNVFCGVTCRGIHNSRPGDPSGTYLVDGDGNLPAAPRNAWCDMTGNGGGWTLVMKANGNRNEFAYGGSTWTSDHSGGDQLFNRTTGPLAFQCTETMAVDTFAGLFCGGTGATFSTVAFDDVRLTNVSNSNSILLPGTVSDRSMTARMNGGSVAITGLARADWNTWAGVSNSVLQANCNAQNFNNGGGGLPMNVRIGILGNQENDCGSPDSAIGVGIGGGGGCGYPGSATVGALSPSSCSGGNVSDEQRVQVWVK